LVGKAGMSFFGRLLHHPRRLWVRRALLQVHLWMGLLLSLYVVVLALTGSVLVFRSELTRALLPKGLSTYQAGETAPIGRVLERFEEAYPGGTIADLQMPSAAMPAFRLSARDAQGRSLALVADAATGEARVQPRSWVEWVYELHVYLLLGKAYGMQVNGAGSAGLLAVAVSGLVVWWPGVKLWRQRLRIGLGRRWRRVNFDLHNTIGFWTFLLVCWWAISGVYFGWYKQVTAAVALVSRPVGMVAPRPPDLVEGGVGRASLEQVLAAVRRASPCGRLFSVSDPLLTGRTVYALVDLRAVGDFSHRDIVTVSTRDARVLTIWHYGEKGSVGDWVLWGMHPLHFGTLWGMGFKILWAVCGVGLASLSVSGVAMYWNRWLRHRL
jgi:uncharacterized iron-regulated membrane protein